MFTITLSNNNTNTVSKSKVPPEALDQAVREAVALLIKQPATRLTVFRRKTTRKQQKQGQSQGQGQGQKKTTTATTTTT